MTNFEALKKMSVEERTAYLGEDSEIVRDFDCLSITDAADYDGICPLFFEKTVLCLPGERQQNCVRCAFAWLNKEKTE